MPLQGRTISRRSFLRHSALAPAFAQAFSLQRQIAVPFPKKLKVSLSKEFRDAWLLDVAPDSKKICLYFIKNPLDKYPLGGNAIAYEGCPTAKSREALQTIEVGSWSAICSIQLRQRPANGSFFDDSKNLYVETTLISDIGWQRLVIDLRNLKVNERIEKSELHGAINRHYALSDGVLLREESRIDAFCRTISLARVILPDCHEVSRVPFSAAPILDGPVGGQIVISADRKLFVHSVRNSWSDRRGNNSVVYRRASDLQTIWMREIEPEYDYGPAYLAITPDGGRVAVAVLDALDKIRQRNFYICVYSGRDGSLISKLPLNGREGIAISPDGKVLAIGKTTWTPGSYSVLTAQLYEISTGLCIAEIKDDRFTHFDLAHSVGFGMRGLQFTPDGKYLITSIVKHTKFWALDPPLAPI
jgi:hypothetical protein